MRGTRQWRTNIHWFLDGDLHKNLAINRGRDLLVAWNFPEHKKVTLNYTYVMRNKQKAFTTQEAGRMINRSRVSIQNAIDRGDVPTPPYSYSLATGRKKENWWDEKNLLGLLDYFASVHRGRPRRDGETTEWNLPTPRELRALIHDEDVMYVKRDGVFVPTWRAKE